MENILAGEIYRTVEVRISGAGHKPPVPSEMYQQICGPMLVNFLPVKEIVIT